MHCWPQPLGKLKTTYKFVKVINKLILYYNIIQYNIKVSRTKVMSPFPIYIYIYTCKCLLLYLDWIYINILIKTFLLNKVKVVLFLIKRLKLCNFLWIQSVMKIPNYSPGFNIYKLSTSLNDCVYFTKTKLLTLSYFLT